MEGTVGGRRGSDRSVGTGKGCLILRSGLMGHLEGRKGNTEHKLVQASQNQEQLLPSNVDQITKLECILGFIWTRGGGGDV